MKELLSPKDSLLSLFRNMTTLFDAAKYPDISLTYQFLFTDIGEGFPVYIVFSSGKAEFREGYGEHPAIVIRTTSDVWLDISGGLRNPLWAIMTKKLSVLQGGLSNLRLLPRLLSKKVTVPRSPAPPGQWSVPARALVMVGNPRKQNGLTGFYLAPFLEGMRKAGTETETIQLYDKKINHCLGCFKCWTATPGVCIQKDDQAELLAKIEKAELIIYAMPLYFHSLPGLVKTHFDRQLPLYQPYLEKAGGLTRHPRRVAMKKSMALFSICGFPEMEQFGALVKTFEAFTQEGSASLAAKILIPGAMELYHNPTKRSLLVAKLGHLREAGEQVVRQGKVRRSTLSAISRMVHLRNFIDKGNRYWHNEMTGGRAAEL
jgi:putative NADPH-quinone reductase